ncbi:hypothetical protein NMG29_38520 [Streptomyces cocklensis]|jgi:hypothetical protein|uniref:Uncharacterized protein n=1 Tax=Actinacidiphila cocklensis TaxID=887465 RepID=A0A9W4EA52_9ACTN|nr:hypothetical protein [Actinacidiphila cocklensis]MDD1063994.1 hypothetical protein [Actinacidiphila cocklensis]WSX78652.1 hypothetical protein OH826_35295 [Streptomyces sp. NBC_00899]CAG6396931.1 hypothetical protein SCOCK_490044 [Actinacidiphila cocklensis]
MDAGHPASAALAFADRFPSWRGAAPEALAAFGTATASLWREITEQDGTAWKRAMAEHATATRPWGTGNRTQLRHPGIRDAVGPVPDA